MSVSSNDYTAVSFAEEKSIPHVKKSLVIGTSKTGNEFRYYRYVLVDPTNLNSKGKPTKTKLTPEDALQLRNDGTPILAYNDYSISRGPGRPREKLTDAGYQAHVYGKASRHSPLVFTTTDVKRVAAMHEIAPAKVKGIIRDMDRLAMGEIADYGKGGRRAGEFGGYLPTYRYDDYAAFRGTIPQRSPYAKPLKGTRQASAKTLEAKATKARRNAARQALGE